MAAEDALAHYHRKRDFTKTPEPRQGGKTGGTALTFVIQKHHASHLHYDFRLELDGTLKSWAVPKGPSLDPTVKRMAVEVEDHPIAYGGFEGTIPAGQYGAGTVIVWDRGTWRVDGDARAALAAGKLKFELHGEKLCGHWTLVRMRGQGEKQAPWLLIKEKDGEARATADFDVTEALPDSVLGKPTTATPAKNAARAAAPAAARKKAVARKAPLPASLAPQLATLATEPPASAADWLYELKFDGYRLLARIDDGDVRLFTRNGHDWTAKLPELAAAVAKLKSGDAWLDGEIVMENAQGAPDFQALQNAFDRRATGDIVYWLFDAPFLDGEDLRSVPLEDRRARLAKAFGKKQHAMLRFSEAFDAPPRDLLASSAQLGFEGIVGKRRDAGYVSRRSPDWIKLKNGQRQEFVIGGYTAPRGSRAGFGALLLGVFDPDGSLRYCGNVGTGFDGARLADIKKKLDGLASDASPFASVPRTVKATWVRPTLLAELSFGEWTREGRVRHAVFQGLRNDKPAKQVVRERAVAPEGIAATKASGKAAGKATEKSKAMNARHLRRITHPERVIDPGSGLTKGDLVAYYADAADLLLPHLRGRPVSLVRAPEGVGGELFFQKHAKDEKGSDLPGIKLLDPALDAGHAPLLQIDTADGVLSAAQMNMIELHTWNASSRAIDRPDRMGFDLDPGDGVSWAHVQEAALLVRTLLDELGLPSFLKTSGGKGLHVMGPLRRQHGWDAVKGFSQALVLHLAQTIPARIVAKSGPKNRVGKVFVDYLRNGFGATTASAWSVRARPGMGVSVPVAWDELPVLTSGAHWTLTNAAARFDVGNTPWDAWSTSGKGLTAAMKRVGFVAPAS